MAQSSTNGKSYTGTVTQNDHPTVAYQLTIQNGKDTYLVDPLDGITLIRGRDCVPAKLTFKVPMDDVLKFTRGNLVVFKVNDVIAFQGYIFENENNRDKIFTILAYDQMRYLKNKDCYVYKNKTASEVIKEICEDYGLKTDDSKGGFADTQYKLGHMEDNKTLADIFMYALNMTHIFGQGNPIYECYSDAGKVMLKNVESESLTLDVLLDVDTMGDYTYKASIDKETYNMVKIVREAPGDKGSKALVKTGEAKDQEHIDKWGRLQYLLRPDTNNIAPIDQAKRLLILHDCETREIHLKNCIGDVRVRGGSKVFVRLDLGDLTLSNYMMVEAVTHHFSGNYHSMDIDLIYYEKSGQWKVTYDNDAAVLSKIKAAESSNKNGTAGTYADTEQGAYSYIKSLGFTDGQTAGILGNIKKEDADFNPYAVNDSGHTGLFQLSTDDAGGNRWGKYCDWCNENKMDAYNNQNQIYYVCMVENGDLRSQIPDDPTQASTWFNNNIEISGDYSGDRESFAEGYSKQIATGTLAIAQPTYPATFGGSSVNGDYVDAGINACDRHYFGENGCIRAVVTAGAYYDTGLAEESVRSTDSVETLCNDMQAKGYSVEPFNGYASKGDILIYGNNDHATISNGTGGCWGNSTDAGYEMVYYGDANYAWDDNGTAPSKIIRINK